MKLFFAALVMFAVSAASALTASSPAATMKMNYTNAEVISIIEAYSKASGQKFVVDPGVRGKISILVPDSVPIDEAFNHLSSALAVNGFAISKQGDTMVIKSARNVQRDYIETTTERPSMKPERMVSWIFTPKYLSVESLNHDLRILASKDGELSIYPATNQIIFSDWASNLNRVAEMLAILDKPLDPTTAKIVAETIKKRAADRKERGGSNKPSGSAPPPPKL